MSASKSSQVTKPMAESKPPVEIWLIATVCFIAPLLAAVPDAGAIVVDSGEPNTRIWTPIVCALSFIAMAISVFRSGNNPAGNKVSLVLQISGVLYVFVFAILFLHWAHGSRFTAINLDLMLYGTCYWAGLTALVIATSFSCLKSAQCAWITCVAIVAAAGCEAAWGVRNYLIQVRINHVVGWREFGTSTPDYLAGYLIASIPITIAAFLAAPTGEKKLQSWLIGLSLLLQIALVPMTGSRTALLSLVLGIAVLVTLLALARKNGLQLEKVTQSRVAILGGFGAIALMVGSGTILHRLSSKVMTDQSHSFDFRKYTWQAAWNLAVHKPLGVGPGLFVLKFPLYEIVAFTRVAHNGYLQFLDEYGFIGLVILVIFVGAAIKSGIKLIGVPTSLRSVSDNSDDQNQANVMPILIAGLVASLAASILQNFMDSDIQMTQNGALLFVAIGIVGGLTVRETSEKPQLKSLDKLWTPIAASAVIFAFVGIWYANIGIVASNDVVAASNLDPLSGEFLSAVAWRQFYSQSSDPAANPNAAVIAEAALNRANSLEPTALTCRRLMDVYNSTSDYKDAVYAAQEGLNLDPKALDLLLGEAQAYESCGNSCSSNPTPNTGSTQGHLAALQVYRQINAIENTPYATVRAVPEIVEYRFAIADYALGKDALQSGDIQDATRYLEKTRLDLDGYVNEDHSMRAITENDNFVPLNNKMGALYDAMSVDLSQAYMKSGRVRDAQIINEMRPVREHNFNDIAKQYAKDSQ